VAGTGPGVLLDARMREDFAAGVAARTALPGVDAPVPPGPGPGRTVSPGFLTVPAARLAGEGPHDLLVEECFGPVTVVARYTDDDEITAVLDRLPGNLTATLHLSTRETTGETTGETAGDATGETAGDATGETAGETTGDAAGRTAGVTGGAGRAADLLARLTPLAGRVLVNAWPTGVAVAPAQHHGGPYPASTSTSTSVGTTAIERWLRPVTYQNTPHPLLPPELHDDNPHALPRRVNGRPQH
ncbi:aldehyde dehydrogenase (NADP(+)), partial [Streptomyces sp. NPDC048389]